MSEVFQKYSEDQLHRTLPALLLQMCGEWGFDALDEDFQEKVMRIVARIGLAEEQSAEEMERRVTAYVRELEPNAELFAEIHEIFEKHHTALGEDSAERYQEQFDQKVDKNAPQVNEERPDGAVAAEELARVMTGKIKS